MYWHWDLLMYLALLIQLFYIEIMESRVTIYVERVYQRKCLIII